MIRGMKYKAITVFKRYSIISVGFIIASFFLLSGEAAAETLMLAGSGSNIPVMRILIKAFRQFHPEISFEETANIGSNGAVRAAADGAVSIGLISRPLRDGEKGLGLTLLPYARTALVIGAHPSVPDGGISYLDLVDIYKGTKTAWKNGRRIIVLTREPGDSTIQVVEEKVPHFQEIYEKSIKAKRWTILMKDEVMNRMLANTPDAIGFSDMGAVTSQKLRIKVLKVNGVYPSPENVRSGSYSLFKPLAFIFRPEKLTAEARKFIDFVLSPTGRNILTTNGYIPM